MKWHTNIQFTNSLIKISTNNWKVISDSPSLKLGEVHLWRVDLDPDPISIDSLFNLLSDDERRRADKYVFARDRRHFVAARGRLRKIVGGYLKKAPEKIRFSVRRYGKPYLSAEGRDLRFNVSHSHGIAVIAAALNQEVGVDIEFVDRNFDVFSIAQSVFSEAEISRMRSLPPNLQAGTFFAGWTRREAFLKATGDGLSSSEELQMTVSWISDKDISYRSFKNDKVTEWSLTSFAVNVDFKAALVVEGNIGNIKYLELADEPGVILPNEQLLCEKVPSSY